MSLISKISDFFGLDSNDVDKGEFKTWAESIERGAVQTVANVAALQAADTDGLQGVFIGGSFYLLDAADTSTADNGTTVIVSNDGGRYKLQSGAVSAATESAAGIVELATTGEATTGTDTERAVTPAGLKAHVDAAIAAVRDGVSSALDTFAEVATALAGKADSGHSHSGLVPAGGTTGQVLKKASGTDYDTEWGDETGGGGGGGLAVVPGYIYGLTMSNNTVDATNDLDIAAGTAADGANAVMITLAAAMTKRLDAAWAAGTGNGGLSTGSKANGTTYFVFLIRNSTSEAVDVLLDVSPTAPTMPTGFDQKALIGAIITTAAGAIRPFLQIGRNITWKAFTHDYNNTNLGSTAVLATLSHSGVSAVPLGVVVEVVLQMGTSSSTSGRYVQISSPLVDDQAPLSVGVTASGYNPADTTNVGQWRGYTNTSGQVRARSTSANTTCNFNVLSWQLPQG